MLWSFGYDLNVIADRCIHQKYWTEIVYCREKSKSYWVYVL